MIAPQGGRPRRGGACHLAAVGRLRSALAAATDTTGEMDVRRALAGVLECWGLHTGRFRDEARRMAVVLFKLFPPPPDARAAVLAYAALGEALDLAFEPELLGEDWDVVRVLLDPDFDGLFRLAPEDAAASKLLWRPPRRGSLRNRIASGHE